MDMNAAGALQAYARQGGQGLTASGGQAQSRRLAVTSSQAAEPRSTDQATVAPSKQPLLTSGLDLLA
jgi:hypothetical protein